jgi:MSHA biogenesis protein MshL
MLVHPRVTGSISVNLKDVTLREALDSIRDLYGYEYKLDGTRVLIQPAGVQTRVFQVNYLAGQRRGVSQLRVTSNSVTDPSTGGTTGTTPGTPGSTGSTPGVTGGAGAGSGLSPLLTGTGTTGRESTRVVTNQEATFWSDICEALVALVFPDNAGAPGQAVGSGSAMQQQQPEDRQRSMCNRRHAASDRSIVVSPQSGVIVVRATPVELRSVDNYLRATQVSVERQVMLEAKIIEVTLSSQYQSGVNWTAFNSRVSVGQLSRTPTLDSATGRPSGSTPNFVAGSREAARAAVVGASGPAGAVFGLALATNSFTALLSFLETQGNVQVLSSPRVATLNNQKAVLKVGQEQLFVSNVSVTPPTTGTVNTPATIAPTFAPYFSGIVLDVMPQIDDSGNITLHVHPSINDISQVNLTVPVGGVQPVDIPTARSTVRETDTIVRVSDGNIVAIGGLMRTEVNDFRSGLPGLMDTAFGWLFRSSTRVTEKKELVILLKPTIIDSDRVWAEDLRETQKRLDALKPAAKGGN